MKKIIICLFISSIIFICFRHDDMIIIPNNAIRFRVIANSNSVGDQREKLIIKDNIEKEVYDLINGVDNAYDVKNILENNLDKIEDIVKNYNVPYQINYGYNYFPTKNYKGILYKAGNYEALVIKLGEGLGDNFWCVLFPPLCLMENDNDDISDIEYQWYVKRVLDKF